MTKTGGSSARREIRTETKADAALPHLRSFDLNGAPDTSVRARICRLWSVGEERLLKIRQLAGTDEWRTENLTTATVDRAFAIVRNIDQLYFGRGPQPLILPLEDGSLSVEWRRGSRYLLLDILPTGSLEWSLVEGDNEYSRTDPDHQELVDWLGQKKIP